MSLAATSHVFKRRYGNQIQKLIMLVIADFTGDDTGTAWAAIDTLSQRAECSRRSVQLHLEELEAAGELQIYRNGGPNGTHRFRILFKTSSPDFTPSEGGANAAPPVQMTDAHLHGGGANDGTPSAPKTGRTGINGYNSLPLPPPGDGASESKEVDSIAKIIQSLRASWRLPLSPQERKAVASMLELFAGMTSADWAAVRRYLAAKLPEGMPGWQPRSRLKFIETAGDAVSYALEWEAKQQGRKPAPAPPRPPSDDPPLSKAELAEFFRKPIPQPEARQS